MSETRNRVRSIFLNAVENYPPERWEAYLDEACGDDPDLRGRVKVLLEADQRADSLIDGPGPLDSGPDATSTQPGPPKACAGTVIGRYKLLEPIGEGGMGVVYRAEQTHPVRRTVALKVIKPGMDSRQVIARFEAERQALALMDHPNIARVLDAGMTDTGGPYFVMELVKGVPITTYCDTVHLTPKERLELFILVCQAIQHAHQKGIIHRDIKPSNVLIAMVDGKPVPKVIDFGVAKAIDQRLTERTMFTQHGAIIGTFEYMSPEQAELSGLDIDTRSDIYALGVLLYELLAGSTPLEKEKVRQAAYSEILRQIREVEPPKPSTRLSVSGDRLASLAAQRRTEPARLAKQVRGELDWIVMKALDKDRTRRYETANGFARDIQRHLDGDPVEAGPPSTSYKLRKFARKHRAALVTISAFAAVLLIAATVGTYLAIRATNAERLAIGRLAETKRAKADTEAALGRETQSRALAQRRQAEAEDGRRRVANLLARSQIDRGLTRLEQGSDLGLFDLVDAHATAQEATIRTAAARLWTLGYASDEDRLAQVLDGGRTLAFSPDGTLIATTTANTLQLWEIATGRRRGAALRHNSDTDIIHTAFSPDGKLLVTVALGDAVLQLWETATGKAYGRPLLAREVAPAGIASVRLSPDHKLLAVGSRDGTVTLWETATGRARNESIHCAAPVWLMELSPDGRFLATTGTNDNVARLWDTATGESIGPPLQQPSLVKELAFSPDGTLLGVSGTDGDAALYETSSGRLHCPRISAGGGVHDLSFSPDGKLLATAAGDWRARLWDTASGQPRGEPMRHRARVTQVAFTPDGRLLASNSVDGLIRLWDVETQQLHAFPLRNPEVDPGSGSGGNVNRLSFSPDGSMLAGAFRISDSRYTTRVWKAGPATTQTFEHSSGVLAVDLSPDGNRLATATRFEVKIRETGTGRVLIYPVQNPRRPWVAFSPDGTLLAIIESDHGVRLLHSATGQPIGPPLARGKGIWLTGLAFSPDGKRLAFSGPAGTIPGMIRVWDTATQELLVEVPGNPLCLAFSPDGRQLAAGSQGWEVSLWDLTGEPKVARSMGTGEQCTAVAYSPDGKRLATGSLGGLVQLWNPATGMPLGPAYRVGGMVNSVDFSPDGTLLAIGAEGQPARVWDLTLDLPYAAVALPATQDAVAVAVGGNGRMLVTGSRNGVAHLFRLPEPPNTTPELQLRTLIGTGVRVSQGGLASIPAEEWQSLRAELRALRAGKEQPLSVIAHRGGPRYGQALLHLRLAHRLREGGKWEEAAAAFRDAIALLEVLVAGEPTSSEYRHDLAVACGELGSIHAERSEWDRAVTHLARAIALKTEANPRPPFSILQSYALACLGAGKIDDYRATCGQMLDLFGQTSDHLTTNNLAWTCALAADAVADPARLVPLAEAAVAARPGSPTQLNTLGAVLYRAGRYNDSVRRLEQSMAAGGGGNPFDWLFLAMAHHRLGHAEEARSWLDRSVRWIGREADESNVMDSLSWGDRLALGLLRSEAEALLTDAAFPADPFAPAR